MKTIVYFGDNNESICHQAKACDQNALLIDNTNCNTFLSSKKNGVFYTSLADLSKNIQIIYSILIKADLIVYCPPEKWSDNKSIDILDVGNSIQGLTESLLLQISNIVEVKNIELCYESKYPNSLTDSRKDSNPQLWISGCSVSHGIGVSINERYGALLSKKLKLNCSFLTHPGSSVEWASNQILKSDLKKDDIVCWGLTNYARMPYYLNEKLYHIAATKYTVNKELNNILPIDFISNENRLFQVLESIRSVINFCEKLEVKLLMFNAINDNQLIRLLKKEKYFYQICYPLNKDHKTYKSTGLQTYFDFGTDKIHPGPITHKKFSDFLAQILDTKSTALAV